MSLTLACTSPPQQPTAPHSNAIACQTTRSQPTATLGEIIEACERFGYPEPKDSDFDVHLKLDLPPDIQFGFPNVSIEPWFGHEASRSGALLDGNTCTNVELVRSPDGADGFLYSETNGERHVRHLWLDSQLRIDPCHLTIQRLEGTLWVTRDQVAYCADHEKALGILTASDEHTLHFSGHAAQINLHCRRSVPPCDCTLATLTAVPAQPPRVVAASEICTPSHTIQVLSQITKLHQAWLPQAHANSPTMFATLAQCQQALSEGADAEASP